MTSPFKFLDSYDKSDAKRFFGRDRETAQLYNAVFASNLTLLYGGSGTGKTSLINCGLANKFYDTDWQPIFIRRGNNFNQSLDNALKKAMKNPTAEFDGEPIEDKIESVYRDSYRPVFLIFDQFEELFVLGKKEEAYAFYKTIRHILDSKYSKIKAKIIISIREEWMAYLHEFEREVPYLFENRVRVERMDDRNLFSVVGGTLTAANIGIQDPSVTIRLILENIRDKNLGVDLTNLQVYLDRVYRKAASHKIQALSLATTAVDTESNTPSDVPNAAEIRNPNSEIVFTPSVVNEVGAINNVISDFLDEQFTGIETGLTQRGIKKSKGLTLEILFTMISNDGTKRRVKVESILENLPKNIVVTADDIGFCIVEFKRIRILRDADEQFELSHDSIAKQIGEKASVDAKNRRKVETLLQQAMDLYAKRGTLLSKDQLDEIRPFEDILRLNAAEAEFIQKSKNAIRLRKLLRTILVVSIMAILADAALFSYRKSQEAQAGERKAKAQSFATKAQLAFDQKNYSDALVFANQSLALQPDDNQALRTLSEAYHSNYSTYAPLSMGSLQTDFTTAVQSVFSPKGDYIVVLPEHNATAAAQDTDAIYGFTRNPTDGSFGHKTLLNKKVDAHFKPVFNEEGSQILIYNSDSTLVLMDTTGKTLNILRGHTDLVRQAFYSKNNQCWVTCGLDGNVIIWTKEGEMLHSIRKSHAWITQMRLSPDETEIATWDDAESKDSVEVQAFPLGKRKYKFKQPEGIVEDLVFDGVNKQVITFAHSKLWYWKNGAKQSEAYFAGRYNEAKAHFNPKGNAFFSRDTSSNLRVQRRLNSYKGYRDGAEPKYFSLTGYSVTSAKWSAESDKMAVLTGGETIDIQDTTGKLLSRLTHAGATDAAFSDDGKQMITMDNRGLLKFWYTEAAEPLVLDFEKNITHLEFSPNENKLLISLYDTTSRFVDFKGQITQELPDTKGTTKSQFSSDGKRFMLLSDNAVQVFNANGQRVTDSIRHEEQINDAYLSSDGNTVFTTTIDSNSVFWQLKDGLLRGPSFKEKMAAFDFSRDNQQFISVQWRDSVRFTLRKADGSAARTYGQYPEWGQVEDVKFMPDNRHILAFTEGKELYLLNEGEKPKLLLNGAQPTRIWVANDRQQMVIEFKNGLELRTTNGDLIQILKKANKADGNLSSIAFSPDGQRIAQVYDTGKVVFWWTPKAVLKRIHDKKQFSMSEMERNKLGL
jgi:WD40 repeat protein/type II secretory pathway pseudopilin PulG